MPANDELLRLPAVEQATGIKRSTIYKMMSDGDFPRPVSITRRAVGWRRSEVQAWLDARPKTKAA